MIKLVVFDYAGTTVDYGCMAPVNAFAEAFLSKAITISLDDIRQPMGMLKMDHARELCNLESVKDQYLKTFKREISEKDVSDIYRLFEYYLFDTLEDYGDLIDGVLDVLKYLELNTINYGSTTGYTSKMMDLLLPIINENGYTPEFLATADTAGLGRPHPHMIYQNMLNFKVDPSEVIKVGDTKVDILEAVNAGVKSVGIVFGSSLLGLSQEEVANLTMIEKQACFAKCEKIYLDAGADFVIATIADLPKVIDKLNGEG